MVRLLALAKKNIPALEAFPLRRHGVLVDRDAVHVVRALGEVAPGVAVRARQAGARRASPPDRRGPRRRHSMTGSRPPTPRAPMPTRRPDQRKTAGQRPRWPRAPPPRRAPESPSRRRAHVGPAGVGAPRRAVSRVRAVRPRVGARTSAVAPRSRHRRSASSAVGTGTGWSFRRRATPEPRGLAELRPV